MRIKSIIARQVINGKGHPALQIELSTAKHTVYATVPVPASKSRYEFTDVYDQHHKRFHLENLQQLQTIVDDVIAPGIIGKNAMDQESIDKILLDADNTLNRIHLGVSTIAAASQAVARLGAMESDLPLFKYLRVLHDFTGSNHVKLNSLYTLPKPVITIYRSASHDLEHKLPVQEVMVMPKYKFSYIHDTIPLFETLHMIDVSEDNHTLETFLPAFKHAVSAMPYKLALGIDMAASRYKRKDSEEYVIPHFNSVKVTSKRSVKKMLESYISLIKESKLMFLEDLFDEDDYSAWKELHDAVTTIDKQIQIVSDDFTATNTERLDKVGMLECSNNVVVKPSQIGTVSECIAFVQRARKYDQKLTVSYRRGDTEDTFISDLAVAINADYMRTGYYLGAEHNAKINRLIQIEDSIH